MLKPRFLVVNSIIFQLPRRITVEEKNEQREIKDI